MVEFAPEDEKKGSRSRGRWRGRGERKGGDMIYRRVREIVTKIDEKKEEGGTFLFYVF